MSPSDKKLRIAQIMSELPSLIKLSVPLVLGLSASSLIGITDTIMLSPLGTEVLAIVALVMAVHMLLTAMLYGVISVVGVSMASGFGARDARMVSSAVRHGMLMALICGALAAMIMLALMPIVRWVGLPEAQAWLYWVPMALFMLPFSVFLVLKSLLDATDRPWLAVGFAFLGVVINVPLNYLLIYGLGPIPALGILGSGIASVLAETLALAAAFFYWRRACAMRRFRLRSVVTGKGVWQQFLQGLPLGISYLAEAGAVAMATFILGWFGAGALAANQIVNSIGATLYMLPLGMATAVAIRIAQADGSGQLERLRPIGMATFGFVALWMLATMVSLIFAGRPIAELLSKDPPVVALASSMFVVVALMQVVDGLQSTGLGALRGLNDTKWPSAVSIVSYWMLALPLGYFLALHTSVGPLGVWIGFAAGLSMSAVVLPARFFRLVRMSEGSS